MIPINEIVYILNDLEKIPNYKRCIDIVRLRIEDSCTLDFIANTYSLTRERIRQLYFKGLHLIRCRMNVSCDMINFGMDKDWVNRLDQRKLRC